MNKRRTALYAVVAMLVLSILPVAKAEAVTFNGGWTQPLDTLPSPSAGFLANNCGHPGYGTYDGSDYHIANDYPKSAGTIVRSIGAGTVVDVQTNWPGSAVFIKHTAGDGTQFLAVYGHLSNAVGNGSTVTAGQQVGTVYSDHLHFGIRNATVPAGNNNGRMPCSSWPNTNGYVNPLPFLGSHPISGSQIAQSTQPSVVSWGVGRLDVFIQGQDSKLWQAIYDDSLTGANWNWYMPNNQTIFSGPAVSTWGPNRLDVFTKGSAGDLLHRWTDSSGWHAVETLNGIVQGAPAAVSWGPDRIDVFVRGGDNKLYQRFYDGSVGPAWQPWTGALFSNILTSSPAVTSWGPNRLDVFARGAGGDLIHAWHDSSGWHPFESLGGQIKGAPVAVSWGVGRIDVFAWGADDKLYQKFYSSTTNTWTWATPGNHTIFSGPGASTWGPNRLDVFWKGSAGDLVHKWFDSSGWHAPESLGGLIN